MSNDNPSASVLLNLLLKEQALGRHKAFVINNEDPQGLKRYQVWIPGYHDDSLNIKKEAFRWAESSIQEPLKKYDKVWVAFDAGFKHVPVIVDRWFANPNNKGQLPHDNTNQRDAPPESWSHNRNIAEVNILSRSPEGTAIYCEQKFISKEHVASSINLVDTSGKTLAVKSYHLDKKSVEAPFRSDISSSKTLLDDVGKKFNDPIRTGTDNPEQATGAIELGTQNITREILNDANSFTSETTKQLAEDGTVKAETQALNGDLFMQRAADAMSAMLNGSIFLFGANGVVSETIKSPPRRYD